MRVKLPTQHAHQTKGVGNENAATTGGPWICVRKSRSQVRSTAPSSLQEQQASKSIHNPSNNAKGKGKASSQPSLPTRTSPKRHVKVRLFGNTNNKEKPMEKQGHGLEASRNSRKGVMCTSSGRQEVRRSPRIKNISQAVRRNATVQPSENEYDTVVPLSDDEVDVNAHDDEDAAVGAPVEEAEPAEENVDEDEDVEEHVDDDETLAETVAEVEDEGETTRNDGEIGGCSNAPNTCPATGGKKRGATRSLDMARIKVPKQLGLMKVHAPKHAMRFVGEFSKELTTEIGCLIRRNLPPHVEDWTKIPAARKESVITELKKYFDFGAESHTQEALDIQMKRTFRNWRFRLKERFLKCATEEEAIAACPKEVSEDEWRLCIDRWNSDSFKKMCETNKRNRGQVSTNHCSGTKSFARLIHENIEQVEDKYPEFDRFSLWYDTHFSKKKNKWVDERSEKIYDDLLQLRSAEEHNEKNDDEIFEAVLPPKRGYHRGLGLKPKGQSKQQQAELSKIEKDLEETKAREEALIKKNEELEGRMAEMERYKAIVDRLTSRFDSLQGHCPSLTPGWDDTLQGNF